MTAELVLLPPAQLSSKVGETVRSMKHNTDQAMQPPGGPPGDLYKKLCDVARHQGTISYGEVAPIAGVDTENPHFAALVGRQLDEINNAEAANGRPLLSAVVIGKENNMPGSGFFACARQLRLYSAETIWCSGLPS